MNANAAAPPLRPGGETHFILVRHGSTDWNEQGLLQGQRDVPLNARGRAQAAALAEALATCGAQRVITSPLQRARETAATIARRLGVPVDEEPDLRERAFGPYEGLDKAALARLGPVRTLEGEGVESLASLQARAARVFARLAQVYAGERLVVVSHGALLNAFLRGIDPSGTYALANASLSEVVHRAPEGWRVLRADIVEHLRVEPT